MFNKIKGFFKNVITNIKYVLHGIKKVFVRAEETVQKVAAGETINYDKLEIVANAGFIASGVAALLLAGKMLLAAKTYNLVYTAVTFAATWYMTHFLMVYGARDFAPEGSTIVIHHIWDKKEKANAE